MTFFSVDGAVGHITPGVADFVYYVAGDIYLDWAPIEGFYPFDSDSGYITRINADGSRLTWLVETSIWSEVEFLAADETGVYALIQVGVGPFDGPYLGTVMYVRKWDQNGGFIWERSFGSAEPIGFYLSDGLLFFDAGDVVAVLDAADGSTVWQSSGGTGGWDSTPVPGPYVAGSPTMWTVGSVGGAMHLYLLGPGGVLGDWVLGRGYSFPLPTTDPTVIYAWEGSGDHAYQVWRIQADGVNQPVETFTGVTLPEDTGAGASMDPETLRIFGNYPYYSSGGTLTVFGTNGVAWSQVMPNSTEYNGIFEAHRAHDGRYMQVAWGYTFKTGVNVQVFDQETGATVFGPVIVGFGGESAGLLHGAFARVSGTPSTRVIPPGTDNYISLSSPSQLSFDGIRWRIKVSHDWAGLPIVSLGGTPVEQEDMIGHEDGYTRDGSWYQRSSEGSVEGLEVHAGVDGMWWQLIALGFGRFLFTNGEESATVDLAKDTWYEVEASIYDGVQLLNLSIVGGATIAVLWGGASISYGSSVAGASATILHGGVPDIAWDEIAFDGVSVTVEGSPGYREDGWDQPSEGWNTETIPVNGGQFAIAASPVNGSVNVFNLDGEILDYGSEWLETDDDGSTFRLIGRSDVAVTVVYFVSRPMLGSAAQSRLPSQEETHLGNLIL